MQSHDKKVCDPFSRVADLIEDIDRDRYGKPLRAALHLCNDLADENERLQHDIERAMANHNADLNAKPSSTVEPPPPEPNDKKFLDGLLCKPVDAIHPREVHRLLWLAVAMQEQRARAEPSAMTLPPLDPEVRRLANIYAGALHSDTFVGHNDAIVLAKAILQLYVKQNP